MKVKKLFKFVILCLIWALLIPASSAIGSPKAESASAESVVHKLQNGLLHVLREGKKLGYDGRYQYLEPIIDQSHDVDMIIKTILGATYWSQLDQAQQNLLVATFRQLTIATYASQFATYDGETFKFIEQRDLPREQALIRSQLITPSDSGTVNFDYVLHQQKGRWRIINILFDGVSDLAIKRGEYRAVMQKDGFQALIEKLKEKIALTRQTP